MKITIEIEDNLQDIIDCACEAVKTELENHLNANKPDSPPLINYLDYSGAIHEIIDGAVPIHTKEINDLFYLHGDEFEQAFDDAGIGSKDDDGWPNGWKPAAIYCYTDQKVNEWYSNNSEEIFAEWQAKQKKPAKKKRVAKK